MFFHSSASCVGDCCCLRSFFHPFHHVRALFTHALPLEVDRRQRRTGGQREQFDALVFGTLRQRLGQPLQTHGLAR